uniref:Annexin 15 n=1 Tax=Spironucleus barkhanus TaxID=103874 RepID=A0A142C667_SPIBA|nr:annexin 15 [Spironucleus barkhanus]
MYSFSCSFIQNFFQVKIKQQTDYYFIIVFYNICSIFDNKLTNYYINIKLQNLCLKFKMNQFSMDDPSNKFDPMQFQQMNQIPMGNMQQMPQMPQMSMEQNQQYQMPEQTLFQSQENPTNLNSQEDIEQIKSEFAEFQSSLVEIFSQTKTKLVKQEQNHDIQRLNLNNFEERIESVANSVNRTLQKSQSTVITTKIQDLEQRNIDMRSRIQKIEQLIIKSRIDSNLLPSIIGIDHPAREPIVDQVSQPIRTQSNNRSNSVTTRVSKDTSNFQLLLKQKDTNQTINFIMNLDQASKGTIKKEYNQIINLNLNDEIENAFPKIHNLLSLLFLDRDTIFAQTIYSSLSTNLDLLFKVVLLMSDDDQPEVETTFEKLYNENLILKIEESIQQSPLKHLIRQWIHSENDDDQPIDSLVGQIFTFSDANVDQFFDILARISPITYQLLNEEFENQFQFTIQNFIKQNFSEKYQNYLLLAHYAVLDVKTAVCYLLNSSSAIDEILFVVSTFYAEFSGMDLIQKYSEFGDFRADLEGKLGAEIAEGILQVLQV